MRHQFGKGERLNEVVVRSRLQSAYAILDAMAGRQHDHRRLLALPQRGQQAEAINARQHGVEDDQVVVAVEAMWRPSMPLAATSIT